MAGLVSFALIYSWVTQTQQFFFAVLGHVSFLITFLSFAQTSIILLRIISVVALSVGLVYNTYVHVHMPPGQNIWPVLIWMGVFWIQNIIMTIRSIINGHEVALNPNDRMLAVKTFPKIHSRDWLALRKLATVAAFSKGQMILQVGDATTKLMILSAGRVDEERSDIPVTHRGEGTIFGEITLVMGADQYNASPCRVVVTSETAQILCWDYALLENLAVQNPRLWAAMLDGFMRSAGFKHGLLKEREHDKLDDSGQVRLLVA